MGVSYGSFGRTTVDHRVAINAVDAIHLLRSGGAARDMILPYGNGNSYGDSCQASDGVLADMRSLNRMISLDTKTGLLTAEAGIMLSEIIAAAAPRGFFPAVVPGTQFVTLGGAIANDVHGKNHHRRATFGCHVEHLELLRSDGRTHFCSPTSNPRLFEATIGGMGLTGIILSATIRLMRVASLEIVETVTPFANLDEYFGLVEAAGRSNEYSVAWIDQLAGDRTAGRGLLITGNHATAESAPTRQPGRALSVPFHLPYNAINRPFLKAFNAAYRWRRSRGPSPHAIDYSSFFFPLDKVRHWNRLYGPRGFFQHQSVIPFDAAFQGVAQLLQATRDAGQGSFLTVLKRFGEINSPAVMSFPRPGYTLTLDFPNKGRRTLDMLDELDAITTSVGGAANPYKDARMSPTTFARSFPDWRRLEAMRDPAFMSSFWTRTAMRLKHEGNVRAAAE